ncbi:hypothetical protein CBS101457_005433 [Exobasidium rhododendri]|nr:hypothetical protein CBS101457_005433 [Exobasidium rhododendri]
MTTARLGGSSRLSKPASRITEAFEAGSDVWTVFNPVVFPTAINLGQGFMNFPPTPFVRDAFCKVAAERVDVHHYSHPKGRPRLRKAVAEYMGSSLKKPNRRDAAPAEGQLPQVRTSSEKLDVETEILITAGANGGMYSILTAFLEPGDEVIFFEPFFDQYEMEVKYNDGVPVYVPLIPPTADKSGKNSGADEWKVDFDLMEAKLKSGKVKAIFLNTPHNPVGKVFTLSELQQLASLCIKYDLLVLSDEVYDCLTFDGKEHIRIASLEGMWDRTVTIGSAGKSFACTGWRVGWLIGPESLIKPTLVAHTRIVFAINSVASEAAAIGLEEAPSHNYFPNQIEQYTARRKLLMDALDSVGFPYTIPHGAYFIMVDASSLRVPDDFETTPFIESQHQDFRMAYFVAKTCDVVCIPATAFSSKGNGHVYEHFLRFSFCKDGEIEEAAKRLQKLKPFLKSVNSINE